MLRTNIEFADLEHQVRMLMVTSAVESEGKSTTIANLAVAMARAGRRVCLVDLDLRRPYVANFFGLVGAAGLTDVALGHIALDRALHPIAVAEGGPLPAGATGMTGEAVLDVLPAGPLPPNPGEFIESHALAAILQDLRDRYDVVLVDAPPMLSVGDPLALASRVDGLVLIARMNVFRRPMANDLRRATGDDARPSARRHRHGRRGGRRLRLRVRLRRRARSCGKRSTCERQQEVARPRWSLAARCRSLRIGAAG